VRGVNIGGWLVLEPWITPSIFQQFSETTIVDEFTLCQYAPNAQQILQSHWSSWTGLGDFQKIAGAGFNTVRIPIGYWAFQKYEWDPYIMGAQDYLDQAIGWARLTGLQVVIDLHGETSRLKHAGT
jgi:glucan 1,3-beta-glucosidase